MKRIRSDLVWIVLIAIVAMAASGRAAETPTSAAAIDCNAPTPAAASPSLMKLKVTIDRDTVWQPRGGEVLFTIEGDKVSLDGLTVRACFGWRDVAGAVKYLESPPIRVVSFNSGSIRLGATVPNLAYSRSSWFGRLWSAFANTEGSTIMGSTGLWIVPIANFRVLGVGGPVQAAAPLDFVIPIGITSNAFSLFVTIAIGAVAFAALYRFGSNHGLRRRGVILTMISTKNGYASLSQFQILLWTFVIGASAVYVMALSGDLIDIPKGALVLLGITGAVTIGAKLKSSQDDSKAATAGAPAIPPAAVPRQPSWSDLVADEDGSGAISMPRLQMLFFTCVSAAFVMLKVLASDTIPEIPEGYLLLMGISNGVYLSDKFT